MASTTVSMPDIAQSSNTPNFSHPAAVALPIKSSPYVLAASITTASPSQAPAIVGEPLGSPPITSSIEDSRLSDTVSPAVSLSDHGLAPIGNAPEDLDESVLEALRKQGDRLQVLKFADTMENLINERSLTTVAHRIDSATKPNPRGTLSSSSTYHRMLIHRCCTYYRLTVEVDHTTKSITMIATTESRIPSKRISELVPQEPVSRPAFKIMRRSTPEQRGKGRNSSVPTPSSASATDSTPSLDNSGSSETGSGSPPAGGGLLRAATETALDDEVLRGLGLPQQQSRSANGASTPRKTYEERRVEYELARNRIFSDYSQKEKEAVKLREDKEREREVRELHRQLAEEEEATGELGRNPPFVPGSFVNGAAKAPNRDQTGSVPTVDATPSPAPSTDAEITPVTYPTLYNPEGTGYDSASPRPFPTEAAPTAPASYENHPQPPYIQGAHPGYNGNQYPSYPLMGMAGVPPNMNAGHGMMIPPMGAYPPYPGMQPGQPHPPVPHGQMAPPNGMNMGQYPMYSQPLANGWADQRQGPPPGPYPSQPIPDANSGAPDQGFGSHPRSIQQNPYWQPPHPGMGNTEMPPPQASVGRGPYPPPQSNVPPHGQNYGQPPPPQFYPPGMQQHQPHYPPQQAQQAFPPPPPPQPQHAPQYGPQYGLGQQQQQRLVPGSQQAPPRGLWNPTGGPIGGPKRGPFNNAARPPQQQHQHHNRVPGRDGQRAGVNRGSSMKDMRENKDYTGVASLIATPMSPASVRSRSRNSSISDRSVSRGPGAQLWPTDGLAPMPMRGTRPEFAGDRRRSGSLSGSVAESVSESGAVTPLDETASLASSTMSSASSTRTFTSTSSKHPSLPSRPDFPQGLPMHRMQSAGSNASRSSHSSVRGKSGSSSASHSRTQSFQSQGRPSPYAPATSDFPPLPSVVGAIGHMPNLAHPAASRPNNAWTGNTRTILMTNGPVPEYAQDQARQPQPNRFEEQDGKFSRPPAKPSVTLYDPKNPLVGKVGASIVVQAPAGEIDGRNAAAKQQDSEDQSKLLAARLEQLVVGEHSAGSGASAT